MGNVVLIGTRENGAYLKALLHSVAYFALPHDRRKVSLHADQEQSIKEVKSVMDSSAASGETSFISGVNFQCVLVDPEASVQLTLLEQYSEYVDFGQVVFSHHEPCTVLVMCGRERQIYQTPLGEDFTRCRKDFDSALLRDTCSDNETKGELELELVCVARRGVSHFGNQTKPDETAIRSSNTLGSRPVSDSGPISPLSVLRRVSSKSTLVSNMIQRSLELPASLWASVLWQKTRLLLRKAVLFIEQAEEAAVSVICAS